MVINHPSAWAFLQLQADNSDDVALIQMSLADLLDVISEGHEAGGPVGGRTTGGFLGKKHGFILDFLHIYMSLFQG